MTARLAPSQRKKIDKRRAALSAERARELLSYDPDTGILTWKVTRAGTARMGTRAGCAAHWNGYRVLAVDGRQYQEHAVAWLIVYGIWPDSALDHINGNRADNRLHNLRQCTASENAQNRKIHSDNKSGFMGVHLTPNGRWRAQIKKDGHRHYLGDFPSPEAASRAYLEAKRIMHPFNPVPREVRRG